MEAAQKTVALIEDDAAVRKAIKRFLGGAGYAVLAFASQAEFLSAAAGFAADCLVIDVDLGGTSGLDLARHPLVAALQVPVVMITGHSDEWRRQQAEALGCVACLSKPFPSMDLLETIARAVRRPS